MHQLVAWLSSNTAALGIMGAAVAFIWSTTQQMVQRKAEAREREFQNFHKLVKELVSPDSESGTTWIDGRPPSPSSCVTFLVISSLRNACC